MNLIGRLIFYIMLPYFRRMLKPSQRAYVIINVGREVLVQKNRVGPGHWQLPGGGLNAGEAAAAAAIREGQEELGLHLEHYHLKLVKKGVWQTNGLGFNYQIFLCHLSAKPKLKALKREIYSPTWKDAASLNRSNTSVEILTALKDAGLV